MLKTVGAVVNNDDVIKQEGQYIYLMTTDTTNDTLRFVNNHTYDNLKVINQSTNDSNRKFVFREGNTHTVTENLGVMAQGTLSVNAEAGAGTPVHSVIDMKGHSGFQLNNESTLNLKNLTFKNAVAGYDGGVISVTGNDSTINIENVKFENNQISGTAKILGSAISLLGDGYGVGEYLRVGDIKNVTLNNNSVVISNSEKEAQGGIYVKYAAVDSISGEFNGNKAESTGNGRGLGAAVVVDNGYVGTITGNFRNNSAISNTNSVGGGAVSINYDSNLSGYSRTNTFVNSNFYDNYAMTNSTTLTDRQGGAIRLNNSQTLNVVADNGTSDFHGNYTMVIGDESSKIYNAIYAVSTNTNINLEAKNDGIITLNDNIAGANNYNLHMTGDGSGKINFINGFVDENGKDVATIASFDGAVVTVDNVKVNLDYRDSKFTTYTPKSIKLNENGVINLSLDVNATESQSDVIRVSDVTNTSALLKIKDINFVGDAVDEKTIQYSVVDSGNKGKIALALTENKYLAKEDDEVIFSYDEVGAEVKVVSNEQFREHKNAINIYGYVSVIAGSNSSDYKLEISYKGEWLDADNGSYGDTLALWNKAEHTTKTINLTENYEVVGDLGTSWGSVLNLNGATNGSVVDMNDHSGFVVDNGSELNIKNVSFKNAKGSVIEADTGSIVNIKADNKTVEFKDNVALNDEGTDFVSRAIRFKNTSGNTDGKLALNAVNGGRIDVYDGIVGDAVYNVELSGDDTGTINFIRENANMDKANITVKDGAVVNLKYKDGLMTDYTPDAVHGNMNLELDVVASTGEADRIVTTSRSDGVITISEINFIDEVDFADEDWKVQVLDNQDEDSTLKLALSGDVSNKFIIAREGVVEELVDTYAEGIKENATFKDVFNDVEVVKTTSAKDILAQYVTATTKTADDSLSFSLSENGGSVLVEKIYTPQGDTLKLWAEYDEADNKVLSAVADKKDYRVSSEAIEDINIKGKNVVINGVDDGSEIDLRNATLVVNNVEPVEELAISSVSDDDEVVLGTTLALNNVTLTGNADNLLKIGEGNSVVLNQSKLNGNVVNDGMFVTDEDALNYKIAGLGTTTFASDVCLNGNNLAETQSIIANGSLDIKDNTVSVANAVLNGDLKMKLNQISADSTEYEGGKLVVADKLTISDSSKLSLIVAPNMLKKGETTGDLQLISAGVFDGDFNEVFDENLRYEIVANGEGAYVISNVKNVDELGLNKNNTNTAMFMDVATFADNSQISAVQDMLNELSQTDLASYKRALTNVAPTDNWLPENMARLNMIISRQTADASVNTLNFSVGNELSSVSAWMGTILSTSKKDGSFENTKFDMDMKGYMFGLEVKYNPHVTGGIGHAFHQADVDSIDRDTDIDGQTFFVYGKYQPRRVYFRGLAMYTKESYKEHTNVVNTSVRSKYNVRGLGLDAFSGYDFKNGVTPELGLRYNFVTQRDFADSLGQKVMANDLNIFTAVANVKYRSDYDVGSVTLKPEFFAGVSYDMATDDRRTNVRVGNETYSIRGEKLSRWAWDTGFNLAINRGNWDLSLGYSFDVRDNYKGHSGNLNFRYSF